MFSAVKNSCWLNNSIIYQTPSKSFFLSAIPFKNQKHLQCNQLQFSFFLGKYSIYILFSLLQICHIFTCYIMPFCFILQICHIHVLLNKWILNLNFSYTSTDKVRFLYSHGKFVKKKVCMDPFKNSQPSSTRIPWRSLPQFCPSLFFFFTFSTVTAIFLNVAWNCNKNKLKQSTTLLASIQRD